MGLFANVNKYIVFSLYYYNEDKTGHCFYDYCIVRTDSKERAKVIVERTNNGLPVDVLLVIDYNDLSG